jgi:uncharacterized protein YqeY
LVTGVQTCALPICKVMALVKPKAQGRADLGAISARIKQKLS